MIINEEKKDVVNVVLLHYLLLGHSPIGSGYPLQVLASSGLSIPILSAKYSREIKL